MVYGSDGRAREELMVDFEYPEPDEKHGKEYWSKDTVLDIAKRLKKLPEPKAALSKELAASSRSPSKGKLRTKTVLCGPYKDRIRDDLYDVEDVKRFIEVHN